MSATWVRVTNWLLSLFAGVAAFVFTLLGFLLIGRIDQQVVVSMFIGLFALLVVRLAAERPNSGQARAFAALVERLLAVRRGDLASPAPAALRNEMPALAAAVDGLFEQVRSNLDNFHSMAMYDPVTSLPNRIHFRREAERILKTQRADEQAALIFIDLDGFKEVNDRLGHAQGDQVLTMVANRLRVVVKAETDPGLGPQPLLARLAGDEFTVLLPDVGGREEAERIAGRLLAALCEPFRIAGHPSDMGASIGVAIAPLHGNELAALMKAADIAMYHAKASGRSRVCFYDAELGRASEQRALLHGDLRRALEDGAVDLVFQPRLCLRTGAITGGDALARWDRGAAGTVEEEALSALAREAGLSHVLGEWKLAAVGAAYSRWRAADLPQRLCVRLDEAQLARLDFADRVRAAAEAAGPAPWLLEVELTTAAISDGKPHLRPALEALRADGVAVTLSGFGAGGASLGAVADLPANRLKLHPALIEAIDRSDRARLVAATLVHLIHGLGCEAVAGPVEREEQLEILRSLGCNSLQGFFGCEAMDEEAFVAWVAAQDCARSLARAS